MPDFSGPMAFDTCDSNQLGLVPRGVASDFDTLLGVYTGASVDALTPVAENDDAPACGAQSSRDGNGHERRPVLDRDRRRRRCDRHDRAALAAPAPNDDFGDPRSGSAGTRRASTGTTRLHPRNPANPRRRAMSGATRSGTATRRPRRGSSRSPRAQLRDRRRRSAPTREPPSPRSHPSPRPTSGHPRTSAASA